MIASVAVAGVAFILVGGWADIRAKQRLRREDPALFTQLYR